MEQHRVKQRFRIESKVAGQSEFEPQMKVLITRVARFMGLEPSQYVRLAVYEKLYRQMREGLLEHRLLAQPVTPEERAMVIHMFEDGSLNR